MHAYKEAHIKTSKFALSYHRIFLPIPEYLLGFKIHFSYSTLKKIEPNCAIALAPFSDLFTFFYYYILPMGLLQSIGRTRAHRILCGTNTCIFGIKSVWVVKFSIKISKSVLFSRGTINYNKWPKQIGVICLDLRRNLWYKLFCVNFLLTEFDSTY